MRINITSNWILDENLCTIFQCFFLHINDEYVKNLPVKSFEKNDKQLQKIS